MTSEQYNRKRRARKRRRARRRQGCLGCMTCLLFTVVLCIGAVAVTGNGQAVADALKNATSHMAFLPEEILSQEQTVDTMAQSAVQEEELTETAQEVLATLEGSTAIFADGITRYYYGTLTDAEKITYLLVTQCVFDMAEEVEIPTQGSMAISDIWPLIRADFPEIFWVEVSLTRTITTGDVQQVLFVPTYSLTADERSAQEAEIEQVAAIYYASLAADATDYQKVQAAYEFVVAQVTYLANADDQTIYGALAQGQAVCAGYARAVQYLLNHVGVVCSYVSGEAESEGERFTHAWNFVQIEGAYYYLDATWGEDNWGTGVDYSYLCVNAQDLATTHFADASYMLPTVAGIAYNYYRMMGYYLETYTLADAQAAMDGQQATGYYTIRFASAEALQVALASLIEAQEIYNVLRALGTPTKSISYTYKETLNILIIYPQEE